MVIFGCLSSCCACVEDSEILSVEKLPNLKTFCVVRLRRCRSAAAYSDQTFPVDDLSVCPCVGLSSALWNNGGSDPDAVWHHRSAGSRDEAGIGVWRSVHGKGYFWGRIWGAPL